MFKNFAWVLLPVFLIAASSQEMNAACTKPAVSLSGPLFAFSLPMLVGSFAGLWVSNKVFGKFHRLALDSSTDQFVHRLGTANNVAWSMANFCCKAGKIVWGTVAVVSLLSLIYTACQGSQKNKKMEKKGKSGNSDGKKKVVDAFNQMVEKDAEDDTKKIYSDPDNLEEKPGVSSDGSDEKRKENDALNNIVDDHDKAEKIISGANAPSTEEEKK